jgi:hypothetical protein
VNSGMIYFGCSISDLFFCCQGEERSNRFSEP